MMNILRYIHHTLGNINKFTFHSLYDEYQLKLTAKFQKNSVRNNHEFFIYKTYRGTISFGSCCHDSGSYLGLDVFRK